jgi:hypothetical protein
MSNLLRSAFALALLTPFVSSGYAQTGFSYTLTAENAGAPAKFSSSRASVDLAGPSDASSAAITRGQPVASGTWPSPLSHFAIGSYTSPLGIGGGAAVGVTRSTNVRVGWNFFNYSLAGTDDGANYSGHLHFRSLQASADWFPFHGGFHISPGLLFNNQNRVSAMGGIAAGNSFTLNDVNYYSSSTDPVSGTGSVHFRTTAPMLTMGWGNWVSRREHKHLSFPFEFGAAYTGTATVALNLQGTVCNAPNDMYCDQIATDPSVQANIAGQIRKIENDLHWIRFYPILSTGIAYKF